MLRLGTQSDKLLVSRLAIPVLVEEPNVALAMRPEVCYIENYRVVDDRESWSGSIEVGRLFAWETVRFVLRN